MVSISVAGSASTAVPAERGVVHVEVHAEGDDRDHVIDRATGLHGRLVAEARQHVSAGAATTWSAAQVTASTETRYHGDAETPVQVATAALTVRFKDFHALGAWVAKIGQDADARVHGIDWALTDSKRAEVLRDVRREAVEDAALRAATYASAAGAGRPKLTGLAEPGIRHEAPTVSLRAAARSADGPAAFTLRPADIVVECTVLADFES